PGDSAGDTRLYWRQGRSRPPPRLRSDRRGLLHCVDEGGVQFRSARPSLPTRPPSDLSPRRDTPMTTPISYPNHPDMPRSTLPFSPVTRVGDLLFVSGQASVDETGKIVPDTFEGEMRRSIKNLARVLEAAGSSLDRV